MHLTLLMYYPLYRTFAVSEVLPGMYVIYILVMYIEDSISCPYMQIQRLGEVLMLGTTLLMLKQMMLAISFSRQIAFLSL